MPYSCAICGTGCTEAYPFRFGAVSGHLCAVHAGACDAVVGVWARRCVREINRAQANREAERAALAKVGNEQLPRGFRRQAG